MDGPQLQPLHAPESFTATKARQIIQAKRRNIMPRTIRRRGRRRMETELSIPGEKLPSL
jgi:hypothetical protein